MDGRRRLTVPRILLALHTSDSVRTDLRRNDTATCEPETANSAFVAVPAER